jgi:hypothetical protein
MCGASALGLGLVLHQLRVTLRQREQAYAELKTTLTRLEDSTKEIRHLMSQLQVVCAWTQRIRIEGKWMNLDEFLGQHLKIPLSHGISPEAMTKFIAEIEPPTQADSK